MIRSIQTPLLRSSSHPLPSGIIIQSPGGQFSYRIVGPCCRLFDREQLPWPCCRIQWHGKEPSWRRIGRRFVADMSARRYPSYSVELIGYQPSTSEPFILTLYTQRLSTEVLNWWYTRLSPNSENTETATLLPTEHENKPINPR